MDHNNYFLPSTSIDDIDTQNKVTALLEINNTVNDIFEIQEVLPFINETIISERIEEISDLIESDIKFLDYLAPITVNWAKEIIQEDFELINQLIESVKNQTNESGLDIMECIVSVESELKNVVIGTAYSSLICVDSALEDATTVLWQILDDVNDINTQYTVHAEKLGECKIAFIPIKCIEDVVSELGEEISTISTEAMEEVEQSWNDLVDTLETCSTNAADTTQEETIAVFINFAECALDTELN